MFIGMATCLTSLVVPFQLAWAADQVQVTADNLNIRSGPGTNYSIVTSVSQPAKLTVVSKQNSWTKVKLPNGKDGWVINTHVKDVPSVKYVKSTADQLNIRKEPNTTSQIVQVINKNGTYQELKKQGDWTQLKLSDKTMGWANTKFLQSTAAPATPQQKPAVPEPKPNTNTTTKPDTTSKPTTVTPPTTGSIASQNPPANSLGTVNIATTTSVYIEPNSNAMLLGQLSSGDQVYKYAESNGWVQILYNGYIGWIVNPSPAETSQDQPPGIQTLPGYPESTLPATVTVNGDNVNIRSQANMESQVVSKVNKGTVLTVVSKSNDWYQITLPNGATGWVAGWLVNKPSTPSDIYVDPNETANHNNSGALIPAQTGFNIKIKTSNTNLRIAPDINAQVVGTVQPGEVYPVVKTEGEWYQIRLKDNSTAYIASWVVEKDSPEFKNLPPLTGNEARGKIVVVDAGHGGTQNGASGSTYGSKEKELNLAIAQLLQQKLEAAGAQVIMTRAGDQTLSLQSRVDVAVQNNADLFISVHHNTHSNSATNGTIMFYYEKGKSQDFAKLTQIEMVNTTQLKDLNARFGDFHVIRENPKPSLLAEIGFISNPEEEAKLRQPQLQESAAEGLFRGILRYFQVYPQ